MPEYSTYNEYNIVGFSELMQEYIRIVRFVPEDRLVCVENVCWGAVWAHPKDIGDYKKRITLPGWENGFTDDHHPFAEVTFAELQAAGWREYVIKNPLLDSGFPQDYHPLSTEAEIRAFMEQVYGLHDAHIEEVRMSAPTNRRGHIDYIKNPPRLRVFFRLPGSPERRIAELLFSDVRDFRIRPGLDIYGFTITPQEDEQGNAEHRWTDRYYVFSTEPCFRWRRHGIENLGNAHYAVARNVFWRIVKNGI